MYLPGHFRQEDAATIEQFLRQSDVADIVTWNGVEVQASLVPLMLCEDQAGSACLLGHLARANPQCRTPTSSSEALAIFRGPDHYVSPQWYPTKLEHGMVVPTWNYVAVHVHGHLVLHDDDEWKLDLVTRLTERHEGGRGTPWSVSDAPATYVAERLRAIVGIELRITRIEAQWKLSQNQPEPNQIGVIQGLRREGTPSSIAVADLMGP